MKSDTATWNFTYNADGLRTGRTKGTTKYTYWYNESGQLVRMKFNSLILRLSYGSDGRPISISYNGNTYYYVLNQQGDVMALLDSAGNWVVKYTYDAWGNILTTTGSTTTMYNTLAQYNPLRYRGYIYDRETKLYYLQSRYYNPESGRFLNADVYVSTGQGVLGNNPFAYCLNNPIIYRDSSGYFAITSIVIGAIVGGAIGGAIIGATSYLTSSGMNDHKVTTGGLLGATVMGAITGAIGGLAGTVTGDVRIALSIGAGVVAGTYTGINTEGTVGERIITGVSTGAIATASTYIGASIDTGGLSAAGTAFANFSTTLAVGTPAEILAVGSQQAIDTIFDTTNDPTNSTEPSPPKFKTHVPILSPYWRVP